MAGNDMSGMKRRQSRILTVPNMLSFFRLCLIPLFVWLYCEKQAYVWTGFLLGLSGVTGLAWNYGARSFPDYLLRSKGDYTMSWIMRNTVVLHYMKLASRETSPCWK